MLMAGWTGDTPHAMPGHLQKQLQCGWHYVPQICLFQRKHRGDPQKIVPCGHLQPLAHAKTLVMAVQCIS